MELICDNEHWSCCYSTWSKIKNDCVKATFAYIQQLTEILQDSADIGEFQLGNLKISVYSLETYENDLIKINC